MAEKTYRATLQLVVTVDVKWGPDAGMTLIEEIAWDRVKRALARADLLENTSLDRSVARAVGG